MRRMTYVAFVVVILLTACGQPKMSVEGFTSVASPIAKKPEQYDGQPVTIVGYFRSQDLLDEVVAGFPPTDRLRDWVIKDNSGAIYIAASELMPFSVSSQDIWRMVRVEGTITVRDIGTSGTQAYIVPSQIQWQGNKLNYDALPAYCTVAIHRFGGTEKLEHHLYVYENRNVIVYDGKTGARSANKLREIDFNKLESTFDRAELFDLPAAVGNACEGCVRYYIAAVNEKQGIPHYITIYEGNLPANLQKFVDLALEFAEDAETL